MNIAYIYYLLRPGQTGVELKIKQQAAAAFAAKLNLDVVVLNLWHEGEIDHVHYVKLPQSTAPVNYFKYLFRRYPLIESSFNLKNYDYLIVRYPLADRTGLAFTEKYRVIMEHHTKEPLELRSQLRTKAGSSALERIARRLMLFLELRYGTAVLRNCSGIIATNNTVRQFQETRTAPKQVPTITIGNGADVANIPVTGFKVFDGKQLDLVFLLSRLQPWQGLERIIASINAYFGNIKIRLHVLGNVRAEEVKISDLSKVQFYGPQTGDALDGILADMNLGISTLALYKKNMDEVSSLKTGEYTARGLPFILANEDSDLAAAAPDKRFFLQFKNDGSLLDVPQIIEFAQAMTERREEIVAYMRHYATTMLDWRVKLQQYVDFVQMIDKKGQQ